MHAIQVFLDLRLSSSPGNTDVAVRRRPWPNLGGSPRVRCGALWVQVRVRMRAFTRAFARLRVRSRARVRAFARVCVWSRAFACSRARSRAVARVRVRSARSRAFARVRARVRVSARVCMRSHACACACCALACCALACCALACCVLACCALACCACACACVCACACACTCACASAPAVGMIHLGWAVLWKAGVLCVCGQAGLKPFWLKAQGFGSSHRATRFALLGQPVPLSNGRRPAPGPGGRRGKGGAISPG